MDAKSWFKTIASALNDNEPGREFHRYPLSDYISYYNAAMTLVAKYKPDDYMELTKVKLVSGKYQDARQCCAHVVEVLDQIDEHGNIIKEMGATVVNRDKSWRKPVCLSSNGAGGYRVNKVTVDKQMNGRFTVEPPVPCDTDAYVLVKCVRKFQPLDLNSIATTDITDGNPHLTAAWHYMLARLLSGDRHAGSADASAVIHYKLFFEILGVVVRQEDLFEAKK